MAEAPDSVNIANHRDGETKHAGTFVGGKFYPAVQIANGAGYVSSGLPDTLGQKQMAASMPVVLPSDQTPPDFVTLFGFLQNGGSNEMNVDGSVTPVNFDLAPTAGLTYFVHGITLFLQDTGTMDYLDFGALPGPLANGVQVSSVVKGASYTVGNIQSNIDLSMYFKADANFGSGASDLGFFNDLDFFLGKMEFINPLILQQSTGDHLRITIRDDLTGLGYLRALVKYKRAA